MHPLASTLLTTEKGLMDRDDLASFNIYMEGYGEQDKELAAKGAAVC